MRTLFLRQYDCRGNAICRIMMKNSKNSSKKERILLTGMYALYIICSIASMQHHNKTIIENEWKGKGRRSINRSTGTRKSGSLSGPREGPWS